MSRILVSLMALAVSLPSSAEAGPVQLQRPVLSTSGAPIENVAYYHHYGRYRHYGHYRHYRRHYGYNPGAAIFSAIVGGVLSNPCLYGGCGYYYGDYYEPGWGYYGPGYGGYYGGGWGGRRFYRGAYHGGGVHGFHGGGFHGGGFHGGGVHGGGGFHGGGFHGHR